MPELADDLYVLFDPETEELEGWTDDLGAARMKQVQEGLELERYSKNPMGERAWENLDCDEYHTLDQLTTEEA